MISRFIHRIKWWYLKSWLFKYTWPIHYLYGQIKCLLTRHFWAGIMGKDIEICLRCNKERVIHD
jgi:hypothetical protein